MHHGTALHMALALEGGHALLLVSLRPEIDYIYFINYPGSHFVTLCMYDINVLYYIYIYVGK